MSKPINVRFALGDMSDLTTPTATQKYPLGLEVVLEDTDKKMVKTYIYVKAHGALVAYTPYTLNFTGTSGAEVMTKVAATTAAPGAKVCVPEVAFSSSTLYGFVQIGGDCVAICTSETMAVGDFLDIANTATILKVGGGGTGVKVMDDNSVAVSKSASYTAAGDSIVLLNRWAVI